jgi:F420H(2)-dependent quinone reductase
MLCQVFERAEVEFFRALNQVVEPLVKAGVGSPGLWPTGAIVVETVGRKTGRTLTVPLVATVLGDLLLVSTVRSRSQWIRNLSRTPAVRYWMHGRPHHATATVVAPGVPGATSARLSAPATSLIQSLRPISQAFGVAFAVLSPTAVEPER